MISMPLMIYPGSFAATAATVLRSVAMIRNIATYIATS